MAETITIKTEPEYDADGNLVSSPYGGIEVFANVQHLNGSSLIEQDVEGETNRLQVFLPSGTLIEEGQEFIIRGKEYTVVYTPWDWGYSRRPVFNRHKPSVRVIVERSEG